MHTRAESRALLITGQKQLNYIQYKLYTSHKTTSSLAKETFIDLLHVH